MSGDVSGSVVGNGNIPDSYREYQHDSTADAHNLIHEWHPVDSTVSEHRTMMDVAALMTQRVFNEIRDKCSGAQLGCECEPIQLSDVPDILYDEYWIGSAMNHIQEQPDREEL